MTTKQNEIADAIRETLGGNERTNWTGDITDALFCGLDRIAEALVGHSVRSLTKEGRSVRASLDDVAKSGYAVADAINNLADAVRNRE